MNIIKYKVDDNYIKLVIDLLDMQDDIKILQSHLNTSCFFEISLLNTTFINQDMILLLYKYKNNIALIVNEKKLYFYLINIGFKATLLSSPLQLQNNKIDNISYVAIGGSAGSLKNYITIVKYLKKSNMTFFIIMHQKDDVNSYLSNILKQYTSLYDVIDPKDGEKVKPATIYIAPSDKHLVVNNNIIYLEDSKPVNFSKPSISVSFSAMSKNYQNQFLAILLCGYGTDGSDSLKNIRKNGGMVIIQQLYECQATPMLENAINTKEFDDILSVKNISQLLYDKITKEQNIEDNLNSFLEDIFLTYGYDYTQYYKKHIIRRINHFKTMNNFDSFTQLRTKVLENKSVFLDLFLDLSVNVTTFFRNPSTFTLLQNEINNRFKNKKNIKIWCAGCSSGEEPYSIAITLDSLGLLDRSLIYATDINDVIIQYAQNGIYSTKSYLLFEEHFKQSQVDIGFEKYFDHYDDFVIVKDKLKQKILFVKHNLVNGAVLNEFDLIICRNVIIYFDKDLTIKVFELFDKSLVKNGMLLLGESELFTDKYKYDTLSSKNKLYLKIKD